MSMPSAKKAKSTHEHTRQPRSSEKWSIEQETNGGRMLGEETAPPTTNWVAPRRFCRARRAADKYSQKIFDAMESIHKCQVIKRGASLDTMLDNLPSDRSCVDVLTSIGVLASASASFGEDRGHYNLRSTQDTAISHVDLALANENCRQEELEARQNLTMFQSPAVTHFDLGALHRHMVKIHREEAPCVEDVQELEDEVAIDGGVINFLFSALHRFLQAAIIRSHAFAAERSLNEARSRRPHTSLMCKVLLQDVEMALAVTSQGLDEAKWPHPSDHVEEEEEEEVEEGFTTDGEGDHEDATASHDTVDSSGGTSDEIHHVHEDVHEHDDSAVAAAAHSEPQRQELSDDTSDGSISDDLASRGLMSDDRDTPTMEQQTVLSSSSFTVSSSSSSSSSAPASPTPSISSHIPSLTIHVDQATVNAAIEAAVAEEEQQQMHLQETSVDPTPTSVELPQQ
eukprot:m.5382 g.5382  ORF g.5382 m.5382 type:complete len:455 (+) comp4958_c0_seq2:244-1608(+)